MKIETFATMRALQFAHDSLHHPIIDSMLDSESGDEIRQNLKLKRLQFDCAPSFYEEVEKVCALLDCSKREFMEMAVRDSIEKAQRTFHNIYAETAGHEFGFIEGKA
jgi:hypothetical protein